MKCVMCNKEMDKAAYWVGGYPVGPKCFAKMFDKQKQSKSVAQRQDQDELWPDLSNQPEDQNYLKQS